MPALPRLLGPSSSSLNQLGQFLPRVEHARFHGGGRNTEDVRALIDRFLVVVNKVDDFSMFRRQTGQGLAQQLTTVLFLQGSFWIVCGVCDSCLDFLVQLGFCPTATRRERLEAYNRY